MNLTAMEKQFKVQKETHENRKKERQDGKMDEMLIKDDDVKETKS